MSEENRPDRRRLTEDDLRQAVTSAVADATMLASFNAHIGAFNSHIQEDRQSFSELRVESQEHHTENTKKFDKIDASIQKLNKQILLATGAVSAILLGLKLFYGH